MAVGSKQSSAGGSKPSSKAPSIVVEKKKKRVPEMEEALRAAVAVLFQCKQQRVLQDRVTRMHWEFHAREMGRKNAGEFE